MTMHNARNILICAIVALAAACGGNLRDDGLDSADETSSTAPDAGNTVTDAGNTTSDGGTVAVDNGSTANCGLNTHHETVAGVDTCVGNMPDPVSTPVAKTWCLDRDDDGQLDCAACVSDTTSPGSLYKEQTASTPCDPNDAPDMSADAGTPAVDAGTDTAADAGTPPAPVVKKDCYYDSDGDTFGIDPAYPYEVCPAHYSEKSGDCNDNDPKINPNALEVPNNGVDDDCTAATPDVVPNNTTTKSCLKDADADGFPIVTKTIDSAADCGTDTAKARADAKVDCDDGKAAVNPDAKEICDGVDNNCAAGTDEGFNVGAGCSGIGACAVPGKWECSKDVAICSVNPGGSQSKATPEVCGDAVDNDCNSATTDVCTPITCPAGQHVANGACVADAPVPTTGHLAGSYTPPSGVVKDFHLEYLGATEVPNGWDDSTSSIAAASVTVNKDLDLSKIRIRFNASIAPAANADPNAWSCNGNGATATPYGVLALTWDGKACVTSTWSPPGGAGAGCSLLVTCTP